MARSSPHELSRRERQIMDVIYRRGQATVADVLEGLADPPGYSAIRALLGILERKGLLKHTAAGATYVYSPTLPRNTVGKTALQRVVHTFYDGSVEKAVAALLSTKDSAVTDDELERLRKLIAHAKREGR